jgi:hypothetical protein
MRANRVRLAGRPFQEIAAVAASVLRRFEFEREHGSSERIAIVIVGRMNWGYE